jgi:hypothetical protein
VTLLAEVVAASTEVAATTSRSRKVAILAELLRRLDPGEVPRAIGAEKRLLRCVLGVLRIP